MDSQKHIVRSPADFPAWRDADTLRRRLVERRAEVASAILEAERVVQRGPAADRGAAALDRAGELLAAAIGVDHYAAARSDLLALRSQKKQLDEAAEAARIEADRLLQEAGAIEMERLSDAIERIRTRWREGAGEMLRAAEDETRLVESLRDAGFRGVPSDLACRMPGHIDGRPGVLAGLQVAAGR